MQTIQWFPGHMAKTKRLIKECLSSVDIVLELVDARIPISSRNPDIEGFATGKTRVLLLNKSDLSDDRYNKKWKEVKCILLTCVQKTE